MPLLVDVLIRRKLYTTEVTDGLGHVIRWCLPNILNDVLDIEPSPTVSACELVVRILVTKQLKWGDVVATVHNPVCPLTEEQEQRVAEGLKELIVGYVEFYKDLYYDTDHLRIGVQAGNIDRTFTGAGTQILS